MQRSLTGKRKKKVSPVSPGYAVIKLLRWINSVHCSNPETLLISSTGRVFGSSSFRSGHADIMLLSCFTRGDIYVETQLWKYGGGLELHNPLAHKQHAEHEVSIKCIYTCTCVSGSLTLCICRPARPPCALSPSKMLHREQPTQAKK